jgi:hypothetical protein
VYRNRYMVFVISEVKLHLLDLHHYAQKSSVIRIIENA